MNLPDYCKTCRFWVTEANPPVTEGECRRYPPPMYYNPEAQEYTSGGVFPTTGANDWCGEHRPITPVTHKVQTQNVSAKDGS